MKTFSMEPVDEQAKSIPCPTCGEKEYRSLWNNEHYTFVRCRNCRLVYQNPQPLKEDLARRYDKEYFEYERTNEEQFFNLMMLSLMDIDFPSVASALASDRRSFLDIGCATGMLISNLKKDQWDVQGVEICRPAAEFGIQTRGVPIFIGLLEKASFPVSSFSVVHCSHLIEHVTDPMAFLGEISRILRPGGYFIATTPNSNGLQARIFGNAWRSAIADHVILYSRKTLKGLLQTNGFEVLRTKTWGGIAVGMAPPIIKWPVDRVAKTFGFGDVMIFLARKIAA